MLSPPPVPPTCTSAPLQKKKRAQRQHTNVFAMFDQRQIGEFKEAFSMMDHDQDGFIDKDDLKDMLASLGEESSQEDADLDTLFSEVPGSINFTMLLAMFGAKLAPTDSAATLLRAFEVLDHEKKGVVNVDLFKQEMMTCGDRFTEEEMDSFLKDIPMDDFNQFNYREWVRMLKLCE
ncbi:Myosin regulatory light polypeptide 9 [Coelomomyces lativittatus]|nr:Myosin regulatory light polypeptide 9 [Coelomomyces lativittatus]